jgi:hypothetical protein
VVFFCMLAWRLGVRGIETLRSWRTLLFGVAMLPWALILLAMIVGVATDQTQLSTAVSFLIAFGIVPIVREILFRYAGYRAVNLYAERRRVKREAASASASSMTAVADA